MDWEPRALKLHPVVLPAALSGIAAALSLAYPRSWCDDDCCRCCCSGPNFTFNPFEAAETMTGYIARISGGDLSYNTPDYNSIFAIGLLLFLITLVLNIISRAISRKFREAYE
jgi:phosphate transport system permease protein